MQGEDRVPGRSKARASAESAKKKKPHMLLNSEISELREDCREPDKVRDGASFDLH